MLGLISLMIHFILNGNLKSIFYIQISYFFKYLTTNIKNYQKLINDQ
jgi:hypothetical protein